jgi:metal-responsive CopG/Arc/MetJ family transcriptional regulator
MQRTTITLPQDLVLELMAVVKARNKTEAVMLAVRDEIRARKKERIKALAGKMDFDLSAEELRHGDHRLG